jgi:DNA (cytosine-5)-methyltransferase 1
LTLRWLRSRHGGFDLKVLDLFSGIGGFSLGLERAGMETIAFCEIDPWCRERLRKHWPDVPIYEDVRELNGGDFNGVDVVCGGYPCQPFSVAGGQKAEQDDRHLWPEMLRVVSQARPTWVICENVYGHIALGLDKVLFDLESEGYSARPFVVPALAAGADHNRERVFIVAHSTSDGRNESTITRGDAPTDDKCPKGAQENSNDERCSGVRPGVERGSNPTRSWGAEPPEIRVDDGLPDRMDRIKALGNAILPIIPEQIGRAIIAFDLARV